MQIIRQALHSVDAVGQIAGGVPPAVMGGVTGQDGWPLLSHRRSDSDVGSSRTSHNMFDGALFLVCDKIVPGLAMAARSLAVIYPRFFCFHVRPGSRAACGIKKSPRIRQLLCGGKVDRMKAAGRAPLTMRRAHMHFGTASTSRWWSLWENADCRVLRLCIRLLRAGIDCRCRTSEYASRSSSNAWMPIGKMIDKKSQVVALSRFRWHQRNPQPPCIGRGCAAGIRSLG